MNTSTDTVFALVDDVVRPITQALPRRPSAREFLDPDFRLPAAFDERSPPVTDLIAEAEHYTRFVSGMAAMGLVDEDGGISAEAAGMYRAFRGGHVRGVVTGVFADRSEPLHVRFYGDRRYAMVMTVVGGEATMRTGSRGGLPEWALDDLPDPPPGPGAPFEIAADERGVVLAGQDSSLAALRSAVARRRHGTVLVDLTVREKVLTEHPHGAFALLDTDLGRYLVTTSVGPDGRWVLRYAPATRETAVAWIAHSLERHDQGD
ncbi:EspG family protein [Amycolatopsis arida]|uniref:EspG family protein n=1 Tax=Amycolatopsis arida TaxID=587909 RepID=A0A1I5R8X2_9PSEU|nr:ESX secretion-associated protein EspG [Amycolatopsis arida]TDX99118.1 ESAT-6 protein secretion system EspG family protein [Amycolatopsis arida]SFP54771.1 EspG family protein [Amycolatopsis arida]